MNTRPSKPSDKAPPGEIPSRGPDKGENAVKTKVGAIPLWAAVQALGAGPAIQGAPISTADRMIAQLCVSKSFHSVV
jgi:hypothetical protein